MAITRLSDDDARILAAEVGNVRGHTLKVVLVDGDCLETGAVAALLESRLDRVPQLRQALVPAPLGLARPALVDDPGFAIENHVARSPARELDADGLARLAALLMSRPLDRRLPLWQATVVERLEGGGAAIIFKIHHAIADGVSSMRMLEQLLLDEQPGSRPTATPGWTAQRPTRAQLIASTAASAVGGAAARTAALAREVTALPRLRAQSARRLTQVLRRELGRSPDASPFDTEVGPLRVASWVDLPFEDVHAAGKAHGASVTVNDVVLSLTAAGLRRWLARAGGVAGDLRVQVPVSLHDPGEDPRRLGNRDSFMFIDVPLDEPDPIARLRAISAATSTAKRHRDAEALNAFFGELGTLSRSAERIARRWTESPRVFGLNVSNVPGPRGDRYVLGRPLRALHSIAEVGNRHALRVSVVSAAGLLSFGICADAVAIADTGPIAEGIREELTALRARDDPGRPARSG